MPAATVAQKSRRIGLPRSSSPGVLIVIVFSIVYFADVLTRASGKFFWYDELFTVYLSRLGPHALWKALADGADYNPPLFYFVTRACVSLFGENNVGVRLPEVLGYWIFSLCLYRFASKRAGVVAGAIAMLFPMVTSAYYYAYEARPHGIVFGFCGVALVCWQIAEESPSRCVLALLGMSASLFGALMMHCYALLLIAPFACAEVICLVRSRRPRWKFWAALFAPPLFSLAIYLPLLRSYKHVQSTTNFANVALPGWSQVGHFYGSLWAPCMAIIAAILLLFAYDFADRRVRFSAVLRRDLLLAALFLLIPVFGVVLGKLTHGPFFHRYFYTAVGGLAIVIALGSSLARQSFRTSNIIAVLIALAILINAGRLAWVRLHGRGETLREESAGFLLATTPGQPLALDSLLLNDNSQLPIAVVNPFDALYLAYYAPTLGDRLYAVSESPAHFTYFAFERLRRCCGVFRHPPTVIEEFIRTHNEYLVFGDAATIDQIKALAAPKTYVQSIDFQNEHFLERVTHRRD